MSDNDKTLDEILAELENGGNQEPPKNEFIQMLEQIAEAVEAGDLTKEEAIQQVAYVILPELESEMQSGLAQMEMKQIAGEVYGQLVGMLGNVGELSQGFNLQMIGMLPPAMLAMIIDDQKAAMIEKVEESVDRSISIYKTLGVEGAVLLGDAINSLLPTRTRSAANDSDYQRRVAEYYANTPREEIVEKFKEQYMSIDTQAVAELVQEFAAKLTPQAIQAFATSLNSKLTQQEFEVIGETGLNLGYELLQAAAANGRPQDATLSVSAKNFAPAVQSLLQKIEDSLDEAGILLSAEKAKKYAPVMKAFKLNV